MPTFIRLVDYESAAQKESELSNGQNKFRIEQKTFNKIPGFPIAYWISEKISMLYSFQSLDQVADPRQGLATGNNDLFLRQWFEISMDNFNDNCTSLEFAKRASVKWFPTTKGGSFRRWYGNREQLAFDTESFLLLSKSGNKLPSKEFYFKPGATWSTIASGLISFRLHTNSIFETKGSVCFPRNGPSLYFLLAFLNSKVAQLLISATCPTLDYHEGPLRRIPYYSFINTTVEKNVAELIEISKKDWDSQETSWDFKKHFLVGTNIGSACFSVNYLKARKIWFEDTVKMKLLEEENNRIFIEEYGLEQEVIHTIEINEITLNCNPNYRFGSNIKDEQMEILVLIDALLDCISYGVGCLLGRYSVEKDGLILADAGATLDVFKVKAPNARYLPDVDVILSLTDEDDFPDDLPTAFKSWLRFISGKHYDDNLRWIEDRLGKDIRSFFERDFYKDHIRRYKSRPIYWMVSSPSGAFRALIYLHRYTKDTVGKILNDYVRPYRMKIDQKIRGLESIMDSAGTGTGEKTKAKKRLAQLEKYRTEIEAWEKESLYPLALKRLELDLDDGVKVNYRKLEGILEPVKQLEGKEEE